MVWLWVLSWLLQPCDAVITPTLSHPFIFFHLVKTGGSTLRELFFDHVFHQSPVGHMTPCHNLDCEIPLTSFTSPELLNRTACSKYFLMHTSVDELLPMLLAIDRGDYGPVECHRGWAEYFSSRYEKGAEVPAVEILRKTSCITVLREPLAQHWSHHYFFTYPSTHMSFLETVKTDKFSFLYEGILGSIDTQTPNLGRLDYRHVLDHCFVGTNEYFSAFYAELLTLFPQLPVVNSTKHRAESFKVHSSTHFLAEDRRKFAKKVIHDGAAWSLARHRYSMFKRDIGKECDLICWDIYGNYWIPETSNDGKCVPCDYHNPRF